MKNEEIVMKCTITIEGNACEKGNKSSLWMTPGLHSKNYFEPQAFAESVKILGPYEHSIILSISDQLVKFLLSQGCAVNTLVTVDD